MKKYKIYIFCPLDPLDDVVGGIRTFLHSFIKYSPKEFDVEFIGLSSNLKRRKHKNWISINFGGKNIKFYPLFFKRDANRKPLIPLSLRYTFNLMISKFEFKKGLLFFNRLEPAILFRRIKSPKIVMIHSDVNKQMQRKKSEVLWSKFPKFYYIFEKYIFRHLDVIYTVNCNTFKFYKDRYHIYKHKFKYLPTMLDTDLFYPTNISKYEIRKELLNKNENLYLTKKWILFVGRLQLGKAPFRMIQTFNEYYKRNKDSILLILGNGNLEEKLKNYVRNLGLNHCIRFMGYKSQVELSKYYKAADVLLLTSNFEGMPISVLEALGSGLPVVSTNVGDIKKVVINRFSGEIVNSFSPRDIAKCLRKVLNNRDEYAKENCVTCIKEFNAERILSPFYKSMKDLINKY
ncbi:MAG: glycosyltransferase family 4 protein [Candidatus Helarchaeota archaeon]